MLVALCQEFVTRGLGNACAKRDMMVKGVTDASLVIMDIRIVDHATVVTLGVLHPYVMPVENVPVWPILQDAHVISAALGTISFLNVWVIIFHF